MQTAEKETPVIQLQDVYRTYEMGDQVLNALDGVDLNISRNEYVAIVGASGSGKSTVMNIIGCLDRITKGDYLLNGTNVGDMSEAELAKARNREIGFIFQSFNLLSRASALKNVMQPLVYRGIPRAERKRLATEALDNVGLGDRLDSRPNQMSGGQRQRVAIARALIGNPAILLADEPTGNLDSKTSYEIMTLIDKLHKKGQTIIMVTHEADIAAHCERVISLTDGKIESDVRQEAVGLMFALFESFRSALESIRAHGFRSLLTSLGIIIGVTSVIAVVSIVQGLSYTINAQFAGLGGNSLTIRSYTPFKKQLQGRLAKLRDSDMQAISRRIEGISHITPVLFAQSGSQGAISYRSQISYSRVVGIGPSYLDVNSVYPQEGRFFTADDDSRRRLVCAVGVDVIEDLEMPARSIGEYFRIGSDWCKIVGIIEERGELLGFSQDNFVLLPYGTAKRIMGASRDLDIQIQLLVDDMNRQDEVKDRVRRVLRQEHGLKAGEPDDFKVQTAEQLTESFNKVIDMVTAVSAGIVGISLLVGGIGIMNIMLVSVTERTREIGILKALGATRQDILLQFLIEALALTMIGGLVGVAIGYGLGAFVAAMLPGFPAAHVPLWAVGLSFGFCAAVGIIFGIVPAAKAAQLNPIDALRYE